MNRKQYITHSNSNFFRNKSNEPFNTRATLQSLNANKPNRYEETPADPVDLAEDQISINH